MQGEPKASQRRKEEAWEETICNHTNVKVSKNKEKPKAAKGTPTLARLGTVQLVGVYTGALHACKIIILDITNPSMRSQASQSK